MRRIKYRAVIDAARLRRFRRGVRRWYREGGRDLPWRRTRDPYAVLVSEILLHQTTVATVAPVYEAFLARFPNVAALAAANLGDVKAITDPLGYKIRGAWLHAIARVVVDRHGGHIPATLDELMDLPGVGRYTAGAVMTFAYGRPAGVLDTNVTRVLARYFRVVPDGTARRLHELWALAEAVVPRRDPWHFSQGLMDFGATCCRAKKPRCRVCPLKADCPSRDGAPAVAEPVPLGVFFLEVAPPRRKPRAKRVGASGGAPCAAGKTPSLPM
jgi:A/G-specific adenine glycosylase